MADLSAANTVSEEDLAKSEELKNKANEFFKGIKCIVLILFKIVFTFASGVARVV